MSVEVGSKVQGKVTGITNFGAFVELPGGTTGLVHISEVAESYVKDINDHLKVGDMVEVKVISEKDGKTALSIKKAIEKPETSSYSQRPPRQGRSDNRSKDFRPKGNFKPKETFEDKVAKFLKSSEENLSSLKRNTETKRGGRGGRRG
ncbi:S1 domain-containing RNA-binding protein [Neobacillus drentensis]|jgi:S1 RNA binding domain protein|uniref:S1 domain-containing RNA-binding protein n=1 Tax=Bacillaceae TaxID=186817 RepID=UPI00285BCA59|nr:S1 domain-containing RNA-binding protein [Bacillus sp. SLBN-46]MDR6123020.1 S1 RNA binding domain protein [Bacillus sp. SLBN-46]